MGVGTYNIASGAVVHPWICLDCGCRTTNYVKKADLHKHRFADIVIESQYKKICEVCGAIGAELHHYAPYHLFGSDCEKWPTGYLCIPCHIKWHRLVTPNMCKKI